jgi:hypothetical protein
MYVTAERGGNIDRNETAHFRVLFFWQATPQGRIMAVVLCTGQATAGARESAISACDTKRVRVSDSTMRGPRSEICQTMMYRFLLCNAPMFRTKKSTIKVLKGKDGRQ